MRSIRPEVPEEGVLRPEEAGDRRDPPEVLTFDGVLKHARWLNLSNNMPIVVCVPEAEITNMWLQIVWQIIIVASEIIVVVLILTIILTRSFTKPLRELTLAAEEINKGNCNVKLKTYHDDEIGLLTTTSKLINNLGTYIGGLNSLAYSDALTSVKNKSSFDIAFRQLQNCIDNKENVEFAMLDCDGLKEINDEYGHDKGNVFLKNSSLLMSKVFSHSDIYRIGGDEFVVILMGEDYELGKSWKRHS